MVRKVTLVLQQHKRKFALSFVRAAQPRSPCWWEKRWANSENVTRGDIAPPLISHRHGLVRDAHHPSTFDAGRRAGLEVITVGELSLTTINCNPQKWRCVMPGKQDRAKPITGGMGEPAMKLRAWKDTWRADPAIGKAGELSLIPSRLCTSPGQHDRVIPVSADVGEPATNLWPWETSPHFLSVLWWRGWGNDALHLAINAWTRWKSWAIFTRVEAVSLTTSSCNTREIPSFTSPG